MEYYLNTKKKEILLFVTAWMDLEGITLNEKSQSEKDKYHMISLFVDSNGQNILTNRNRLTGVRGEGFVSVGEKGEGTKQNKTKSKLTDTINSMVIMRGNGHGQRGRRGYGEINGR